MTDDVLARKEGRAGRITMNRPKALNALTHDMVLVIERALEDWHDDPEVQLVLMDSVGDRAFCAGGDIADIYQRGRTGDFSFARDFWADEFRLNAAIGRYPKPVVALMKGYVLGGGVGLTGHASHRIVGESSRVAMPECAIGYVPDVGGTHLLGRAPGRLGEYLGLTGWRMGAADAILAGFADTFVPEALWPDLAARLIESGDAAVIADFAAEPPAGELAGRRDDIDDAFSAPDLATLVARLEASDWGHETLTALRKLSPLSMAATMELVRAARREPGLELALARELRAGVRIFESGDMMEGVRAQVIDKDRSPQWADTIDSVTPAQVAALMESLGPNELKLPQA
ncbi:enoyl-CoA hydratase/isomerase family protein [Amaricoccus sp.]|uniref:enoyl-CoA hydratase/isomerase family protein n=1 Tax=Amaricoccus sp. TaxID=1872485 RepID=UPI001B50C443|nr:enoyl-CoA hydratase/isomerase family protein [Amaricoccus sp.]MBP7242332.1 enoyl-CoA hydratase/isomerase family protein [Amaricoccus sp.]